MSTQAFINEWGYLQALQLHLGREAIDNQEILQFEQHAGIRYASTLDSDVEDDIITFNVIDAHKYMIAKIKYGW